MTIGYGEQGQPIPLSEIRSVCNDSDACMKKREPGTSLMPFMKIPANQEFVIGVMIPVHQPGESFFTCSKIVEESSIQNLLALSYALEKVNQNITVLPEIQLGNSFEKFFSFTVLLNVLQIRKTFVHFSLLK